MGPQKLPQDTNALPFSPRFHHLMCPKNRKKLPSLLLKITTLLLLFSIFFSFSCYLNFSLNFLLLVFKFKIYRYKILKDRKTETNHDYGTSYLQVDYKEK